MATVTSPTSGRLSMPVDYAIWNAPLVPVALAGTAGIVLDRLAGVPLPISVLAAASGLLAWLLMWLGRSSGLPFVYLWFSIAALGAGYHHAWRESFAAEDIGALAETEPKAVQLRGVLEEEPAIAYVTNPDPLRS